MAEPGDDMDLGRIQRQTDATKEALRQMEARATSAEQTIHRQQEIVSTCKQVAVLARNILMVLDSAKDAGQLDSEEVRKKVGVAYNRMNEFLQAKGIVL